MACFITFKKKRGVPPASRKTCSRENSFPQICVVSVNKSVEMSKIAQDYSPFVSKSNKLKLLFTLRS
jgi:hypothetical protein